VKGPPVSPRRLLEEAVSSLAAAGVASPEVDAEILLSHVTGVPRSMLKLRARPQPEQWSAYRELIDARARRVPLQHLTGSAPFRHVDLDVGPGVFIPRPETELLAGWAVEEARSAIDDRTHGPIVVDLCTGSGAIALSIVREVSDARVYAVELDENALEWAIRNLTGTGVDLRLGDAADAFPDLDGRVDVVVANPPYIPLDAWESVAPEARDHDPSLALWSGQDGLDAIRAIEATAWRLLKPGGVVGIEHADAQGESAPAVFAQAPGRPWADVVDNPDLSGRPRYVTARRP
jgi:release factor glutamine methyltransferase